MKTIEVFQNLKKMIQCELTLGGFDGSWFEIHLKEKPNQTVLSFCDINGWKVIGQKVLPKNGFDFERLIPFMEQKTIRQVNELLDIINNL